MAIAAIAATTISNYAKGVWINWVERHPFWNLLKSAGNIVTNVDGTSLIFPVRAGRYTAGSVTDYQDLTTVLKRNNLDTQATLSWAEILTGDIVTAGEFAQQGSTATLQKLKDIRIPNMVQAMFDVLNSQVLTSDDPTDTSIIGLPSMFAAATESGIGSALIENTASDTYGGLSTVAGAISVDGAETDAWTPGLINLGCGTTTSLYVPGTATYLKALQYAISKACKGNDSMYKPDVAIFTRLLFGMIKNATEGNQRFVVVGDASKEGAYGSNVDVLNIDGVKVMWDDAMPSGVGYVLNLSQMGLKSLQLPPPMSGDKVIGAKAAVDGLFDIQAGYDENRRAQIYTMTFRGQLWANPRYQVKLKDYK